MRDDVTLGIAVLALALSAWNFWMTHWGSTPRYAVKVEHQAGATFILRNVGRKDFIGHLARLRPDGGGGFTSLPSLFDVRREHPVRFDLELYDDREYPATLALRVRRGSLIPLITDFPFSKEAQEAARMKPAGPPAD